MEQSIRKYPALPVLVSVIAGILPFTLFPEMPFSGAAFFVSALMLGAAIFIRPHKYTLLNFILPLFAGFMASYPAVREPVIPETMDVEMYGATALYGDFEVVIDDSSLSPGSDFPGNPRMVKAHLLRYAAYGTDEWHKVNTQPGVGLLIHPSHDFQPGYGDKWRIRGLLSVPEKPLLPDTFDYAAYLRKQGISLQLEALEHGTINDDGWDDDDRTPERIFANEPAAACRNFDDYSPPEPEDLCLDEVKLLERGTGFYRKIFDLRGRILHRICDGMESDQAKALAAGIFFGFPQTVGREIKNDFFRSGTIHILTVSGTHVGLFAALVFLVFFFLPNRFKVIPVLILTLFYAQMTGMREPAMRAYFMMAVFLMADALHCRTKSLNTLAVVAALLLVIDPGDLTAAGFQFSFLIVAALLLTSPAMIHLSHFIVLRGNWVPSERKSRLYYFGHNLFFIVFRAAAASLIALAASIPLTAYYQGQITFNSLWVNILLIPLVFLCFTFALLTSLWTGFQCVLQELLELVLYLCNIAGTNGVLTVSTPSLWSICCYYLCFLFLFLPGIRTFIRISCLCILILFPLYWYGRTIFAEPEMLLLAAPSPDSDGISLCVALTDPATQSADVMNVPSFHSAMEIKSFLQKRGIEKINVFLARYGRTASAGGMKYLSPLPVTHAYLYKRQTRYAGKIAIYEHFIDQQEKDQFFEDRNLTLCRTGDTFSAKFRQSGTTLELSRPEGGGTRLRAAGRFTLDETFIQSLNGRYMIRKMEE